MVFVKNRELSKGEENRAKKFYKKWIGPYKILSKFHNTYILDMPARMIPKRYVEDLKLFHERQVPVLKKRQCKIMEIRPESSFNSLFTRLLKT
jgi:hypothetical protein